MWADLFEDSGEEVGCGEVEDDVLVGCIAHVKTAQLHVAERDTTQPQRLDDQRPVARRYHLMQQLQPRQTYTSSPPPTHHAIVINVIVSALSLSTAQGLK